MNVKKLVGSALVGVLLLTGCGGKTVDGKSVVASTSQGNVFADDLYTELLDSSSGKNSLFSYVLDELIDKKYPVTSDMKENADSMIKQIKASYQSNYGNSYEKQLESDLQSSGYGSLDDYYEKFLYSLQYAELMKDYVKNNFDTVYDDYYKVEQPKKVSIITIACENISKPTKDEKAKLDEVLKLLKEGKKFGDVAKDYSSDTATASAKGDLGIIDSTSSIGDTYGSDVLTAARALKKGETSKTIKGTSAYCILYCTETSKAEIKKELKTVDINSPLLTYDNYMVYLAFKTYKINYGDDDIKKKLEDFISDQLKERKKARD